MIIKICEQEEKSRWRSFLLLAFFSLTFVFESLFSRVLSPWAFSPVLFSYLLTIRYHLVRCYVSIGEIIMRYCITEEMVADLLTKIVVGAQDTRLAVRFYTLCPKEFKFIASHE
jgi:hypothetical protein